jgi:hypothetical protein
VTELLDLAQSYVQSPARIVAAGTASAVATDWTLAQV